MNPSTPFWIVYVVAYDEAGEPSEAQVEPYVGKERIENPKEAELSAFLRGGNLAATLQGNEADAERTRLAIEAEVLRR